MMPNPSLIMDTVRAYQKTAALSAAVTLDIFTTIAAGAQTAIAIADRSAASEKGIRILCDYLVIMGLLEKQEGLYSLTEDSATFLNRNSPAYLGGMVEWTARSQSVQASLTLADAVRKGGTALEGSDITTDHDKWIGFARGMMNMMKPLSETVAAVVSANSAQPGKVLDIAASHGMYGISIAKHHPQAEIYAVDWEEVLTVAAENAEAAGIASRYHLLPGSAFEVDFGNDYDLVLIPNFFHHFDLPTCQQFMEKVYSALKPGGRAVTVEFIPNPDRVTPPQAAGFSLTMLTMTPGGDAYTWAEFEQIFHNAGFERNELVALDPSPERAIISYK
ncbi:class I SAM-dependent methyltransferase [Laspinema olomoucense]|uniref:Methyltransferase domain-containing protein n=1 Tax=Laspinema olomoucense D3b TaxID=2953688 RepID=A0ABT2NGQ7_9CYAN|nr:MULTISPECIES: class I SAM-dependent methyltransferase [unclassified Laspinema]MCT7971531.1 methyltransferase domain-containing protein [Laspinema sp. D3d]MCT7980925.1 methyltransferase domain-containing protein [Laspinema sp. D3b]MCT7990945.1 methyltransferase domain-containing protein [Laspinema sp. D3a]